MGGGTYYRSSDPGYRYLLNYVATQNDGASLGLCYQWDGMYPFVKIPQGNIISLSAILKKFGNEETSLRRSSESVSRGDSVLTNLLTGSSFEFSSGIEIDVTNLDYWALTDKDGNPFNREQKEALLNEYLTAPPPVLAQHNYDLEDWRIVAKPMSARMVALIRASLQDTGNELFRASPPENGEADPLVAENTYYVVADQATITRIEGLLSKVGNAVENVTQKDASPVDSLLTALEIIKAALRGEEFSWKNIVKGGLFLSAVFGVGVTFCHDLYALAKTVGLFGVRGLGQELSKLWMVRTAQWGLRGVVRGVRWVAEKWQQWRDKGPKDPPTSPPPIQPHPSQIRQAVVQKPNRSVAARPQKMCVNSLEYLVPLWLGMGVGTAQILKWTDGMGVDTQVAAQMLSGYGVHTLEQAVVSKKPAGSTSSGVGRAEKVEPDPWYHAMADKTTAFGATLITAGLFIAHVIKHAPKAAAVLGEAAVNVGQRGLILFVPERSIEFIEEDPNPIL